MNTGDGFGDWKHLLTALDIALCVSLTACGKKPAASKLPPDLARSVAEKRLVTKELANLKGVPVPRSVWEFYDRLEQKDWPHATNVFERLREQSGTAVSPRVGFWKALSQLFANPNGSPAPTALTDAPWCAIHETFGLALCPYSPEAVYGYADLLVKQKRVAEAVRVTQTCLRLDPSNTQVAQLLQNLKQTPVPRANGP